VRLRAHATRRAGEMAGDNRGRRSAEQRLRVDVEIAATTERERAAAAAKTTRLRALRLAKEAADRAAILAAAPPPRRARGSIRTRSADGSR
jgi:hypothetical protein